MHDNANIKLRGAYIATPASRGGRRVILRNIDLDVSEGELIYLIGKVGSGKSSLLKTLYGEAPLARGKGLVAGFRLDGLTKSDIPMLRRKLGMVFQDFQLLQDRTVYQNMSFVLRATGWRDAEHIRHRIEETLDTIGLRHKMNSMPHQLSGGEQQRVAVGRAFLNRPAVILADEPTGNLDPESASEVMELFIKLASRGCSVLLATHNVSLIEQYPARIVRINGGALEEVDHAAVFGAPAEAAVSSYMPEMRPPERQSHTTQQDYPAQQAPTIRQGFPARQEYPATPEYPSRQAYPASQTFIPQRTDAEPFYRQTACPSGPALMFVQDGHFAPETRSGYVQEGFDGIYDHSARQEGYTPLFPGADDFFTPASEAPDSYHDNGGEPWSEAPDGYPDNGGDLWGGVNVSGDE